MPNYDTRHLARNKGDISSIISDSVRQVPQTNFFKAVVTDVLIEPSMGANPSLNIFEGAPVKNERYASIAPRNSIVALIVSDAAAKKEGSRVVCFPFFPPHLAMPVNPGETVWVMTDSVSGEAPLFYWMCRVSEPDFVDDVNYTHSDRRFQGDRLRNTSERAALSNGATDPNARRPSFPNGAGTRDATTLSGGQDAYDNIVNQSTAYTQTVKEPVPRFSKRPGDLVLQGSNNALISLGYARNGPNPTATSAVEGSPESDRLGAGTVDIVTGRGQSPPTAPATVENSRNHSEVDKAPGLTSLTPPAGTEGDPDFANDLSRLMVTMRANVDADFAMQSYDGATSTSAVNDDAFVVAKSNNVRVVARENGTVRIIKEGANRATVQIEADGTVIIDGPTIIIGSGTDNQTFIGDGADEPVILGKSFLAGLDVFLTALETAVGNLGVSLVPINVAASTFKAQLESYKSTVAKVK